MRQVGCCIICKVMLIRLKQVGGFHSQFLPFKELLTRSMVLQHLKASQKRVKHRASVMELQLSEEIKWATESSRWQFLTEYNTNFSLSRQFNSSTFKMKNHLITAKQRNLLVSLFYSLWKTTECKRWAPFTPRPWEILPGLIYPISCIAYMHHLQTATVQYISFKFKSLPNTHPECFPFFLN